MSTDCTDLKSHLVTQLGQVVFGMEPVIHGLALALIARGHILLEGPPGVGKTRLSKGFAAILGGSFKRIQGTADLMPTDMTGVHVFNPQTQQFVFQEGPLFADVVLVDEINRAGPKTQSALLEAMEERQVSVDRDTFRLATDFLVIATQNPREFEGTFPLPESQLDRFALAIPVGYPDRDHQARVIEAYSLPAMQDSQDAPMVELPAGTLSRARQAIGEVHMSEELVGYMLDIAAATRDSLRVNLGLSTRGALMLARCARIQAALRGADFVVPDDVLEVAPWVVPHRLVLTAESAIEGLTAQDVLSDLLSHVPVPK